MPETHDTMWTVYLAGEIHSDWRERIRRGIEERRLPVRLTSPVTDHEASDLVGVRTLGEEESPFWRDRKGAGINAIRTRTLIARADIVVVRFAGEYREWNAAFDAGRAVSLGKPLVLIHDQKLDHALKEVGESAQAVARTPEQVVEVLAYVVGIS